MTALDFGSVIQAHHARYPQMEPQDYGKLAYQVEFGPGHMALEPEAVLSRLQREWAAAPLRDGLSPVEDMGNGLSRFHLTDAYDPVAAELLSKLFLMTAREHQGSRDGLSRRLDQLAGLDVPGMGPWLDEYKRRNCPSLHHSRAFQAAYHPHYRLLRSEYAHCFPALLHIARLLKAGGPVIAAIDGRCGSGKTHFAALIQTLFACSVIHMDDFYLPMHQRASRWQEQIGGNMDFSRLLSELLIPARSGEPLVYRPCRCRAGQAPGPVRLPPRPLTVVEGCYSTHPSLVRQYDVTVFLTCARQEQERRLKLREGGRFSAFQDQWIPMEERYFKACGTQRQCCHVIDTSSFLI